jgi:hypothetical protein
VSSDLALLLALTFLGLLGLALILTPEPGPVQPRHRTFDSRSLGRGGAALVVGLSVLAVSGWVIPSVICGIATWVAAAAVGARAGRTDGVHRIDALASWIENLRDVLLAGEQPVGAIRATVDSCPDSIRPAVRRLAAALGHQDPEIAFRRFADDIDDPLGDLVAAGLLIAVQRGARTVAVLTALAEQARAQADRRRIIDAERAPLQREVTILTMIMGALIVGLFVFGRAAYLAPYSTFEGQLVLGVVLCIYAVLLVRVQRLARFPAPRRFFGGTHATERARVPEVAG